MKTYIALLRGVNVSGQKIIPMEKLRESFRAMGFKEVTSYVQSGNMVFKSTETATDKLEGMISEMIGRDFGFEVPVIVLTIEKLSGIIEHNSFSQDAAKDKKFLYVAFLSAKPGVFKENDILEKIMVGEEIAFSDDAVYLYLPFGAGRTKLSNNLLESKLKVMATSRNWNTTNELLRIALEKDQPE